jgi:hypothetical protein
MSPFLVTSLHFLYLHLSTISQIMSSAYLSNTSLNTIISFTHYLPTAGLLLETFLPIPHIAQPTLHHHYSHFFDISITFTLIHPFYKHSH